MNSLKNLILDEDGALSFEWILITTLLVLGVVGGMAAVRDAFVISYGSGVQAVSGLDQNFGLDAAGNPDTTCPYSYFNGNSVRSFELEEGTAPPPSTYPAPPPTP